VANVERISGVVLKGRWLPKERLQALLDEQAESYRRPPSRFEGMPPLPGDGEEVFSGRFELRRGRLVVGEERLAIRRRADGRLALDSQASLDPYFDTRTTLHVEFGPDAGGDLLTLRREADDGTSALALRRVGGRAVVSGDRPYYGRIGLDEPLDPGAILGGPMLANDLTTDMAATFVLAAEALAGLGPGQSRELRLKQLELNPGEFLRNATLGDRTWAVVRKADVAPASGGGRSYEITTTGRAGVGSYTMTMTVDLRQRPREIVVRTDSGEDTLRRI
jgi:hypothetical protein